jgi:hypothetical protein
MKSLAVNFLLQIQNATHLIDNSSPKKLSAKLYSRKSYENRKNDIDARLAKNLHLLSLINRVARSTVRSPGIIDFHSFK